IEDVMMPKPSNPGRFEAGLEGRDILHAQSLEDVALFNYQEAYPQVDEMLKKNNIKIPKNSDEYRRLCHGILRAKVGFQEMELEKHRGNYGFKFPYDALGLTPVQQTGNLEKDEINTTPKSPAIKDLVKDWFKENTKAELWKPRTLKQYTGHLTIILQIIGGNTPILSVDFSTIRDLKKTLIKLPTGMNKKKIFQGKSIQEIIEMAETENIDTLNVTTINSYIITLGAFFKWCVGNGHMPNNYAEGMKIKVNKQKRPDEIRDVFTKEHLNSMFQSAYYRDDAFERSYQFWLPILGLYMAVCHASLTINNDRPEWFLDYLANWLKSQMNKEAINKLVKRLSDYKEENF
ncbi:hypothetical protein QUF70_18325, partial [Desulfobacterales bacterium HSG17]|nr:hypothetical protein [Desulfobacterales bacterium HSG17]